LNILLLVLSFLQFCMEKIMVRAQNQLPKEQVSTLNVDNFKERRQQALLPAGRFHSGHDDIATRHDDYLAEVFK